LRFNQISNELRFNFQMSNSFGEAFRITTFGESHGKVIGVIIDGCPSGLKLDTKDIQIELDRRKPGQSELSSSRKEPDEVKILSGVSEGYTTGAPIALVIENQDAKSKDYEDFKNKPRPSHADYPAQMRFGKWVDLLGSGRFSGRNTAAMVMAGAIAKLLLKRVNVSIAAYTQSIHNIIDTEIYSISSIIKIKEPNSVRGMNPKLITQMENAILEAKNKQDSVGGTVTCIIEGMPPGIGEPMFRSIESELSSAIFSIPAVRGVEFGLGFKSTLLLGSQHNDPYCIQDGKIQTRTNNSGGIIGGISTGMPIRFTIAIKPTASIGIEQDTVDLAEKSNIKITVGGRHDPCIVPRVIPVVESMAAIVLINYCLESGNIPRVLKNEKK
jgi:chorismate synthase